MKERRIARGTVDDVVARAEVTFSDPGGNPCYVREVGGRRIKVVVAAADDQFVITVIDLDA